MNFTYFDGEHPTSYGFFSSFRDAIIARSSLHYTLGNDSVLQRALHRFLNGRAGTPTSADALNPSPDLNGTASLLKGIKSGLLLEAKKPLERTPHFFEPGVGECVNATGLLADEVRVELTFYDMMSCTPQCYPIHINVCLSRLSLKFLRDGSVNVGHYCNTETDFCSSMRLLHSSVGVGFPRSPDKASYSHNEARMVLRPEFESGLNGF